MNELSLNLAIFGLNMHQLEQSVASYNITNKGIAQKITVDFEKYINDVKSLSNSEQLVTLKNINNSNLSLDSEFIDKSSEMVSLDIEHGNSTKAMLEYQALVETVNRKMGLMKVVFGEK
jgi:flagellar basal body rod protein FlgB